MVGCHVVHLYWLICGTDRGLPVSCQGSYIEDSIDGFFTTLHETAMLTKNGFGTSAYLGDIRPRGEDISNGGKASGSVPVFKQFVQTMRMVTQGNTRRGAWAGYLPIDHGDFDELCDHLREYPDDANVGWNITDDFIQRLEDGDKEAIRRYQKVLKTKALTGKGYFFFVDKVNRHRPDCYKKNDLDIKASNLCTEINLHSSKDYSYTCVLSSINAEKYDEMDEDAVFNSIVFLDCVASEFIERAKNIHGLEKAVAFTEKSRALGLGLLGFHSYLQKNDIPFESLDAQYINNNIFKHMREEADRATEWMAEKWGEPEWCQGFNRRNSHCLAVAPNMSSALIMGGVSQGIEPFVGNAYIQGSAGGEYERVNPEFLKLMKRRGKYSKKNIRDIADRVGSVQHLDWLTDHEKLVFKTAFEINQEVIVRLAGQRQKYLDQGQSVNLFFSADEEESFISQVHKQAFLDENVLSLYYMRTESGVSASSGECVSCQG